MPFSKDETDSTPRIGLRALLMLLLAAFFWGSGNVANKTVLDSIDPWTAVLLRCLVAAVVLLPFAWRELRHLSGLRWMKSAILPSALFALAILLQQKGFETASVTNASFLVNVGCVVTPLLAVLLLREMPDRVTILAALLMFAGAAVMSGVFFAPTALNPSDVLCLLSSFAYAGWAIALGRHAMRYGRPVATTLMHSTATAFVVLPVVLADPSSAPALSDLRDALPEVLYLGVFSTALAFLLTVAAQAHVPATTAMTLIAAESLFGAAGAILFLDERPAAHVILGAALMLAAICAIARAPMPAHAPVAQCS